MTTPEKYDLTPRPLAAINAADYRTQGFLITEQLFDDATMATVRGAFEDKWRELESSPHTAPASLNNLFPVGLHRDYAELAVFLRGPVFQELCRRIVGPDADQTWNQGIIKPGHTGGRFSWHQDAHFAATVPMDDGFTCWLAVTRTTIANGTLCVAPNYYGRGLLPHVKNEENGQWECRFDGATEPEERIAVELEAGQMLIFSRMLPHTSGPNQTDGVRMAYQIGYGAPGLHWAETGQPFGDMVPLLRDDKPCV